MEKKIPRAVWEGTFTVFGVTLRYAVLTPRLGIGELQRKPCSYCRWCRPSRWFPPNCISPKVYCPIEFLSVPTMVEALRCSRQRHYGWLMARLTGTCGKEGRFWEFREEDWCRGE
jgi:hypothetical protein